MSFLSYPHTCIIYNAIVHNNNPSDNGDVSLLQNLRTTANTDFIIDYYNRSAALIPFVTDNTKWNQIYIDYVVDIVEDLRSDNKNSALTRIANMLDSLESTMGV